MQRSTKRKGISVREGSFLDSKVLDSEKLFEVLDNERQKRMLVVIRRVNGFSLHGHAPRQIVRFSKREQSPSVSTQIWLSTLASYREGENLQEGQHDPMEGHLTLDAAPFIARHLSKEFHDATSSFSACATFVSSIDPWVYCTSFCPVRERDAYKLARCISSEYDTITDILNVDAFALELGVDFAITLDPALHTIDSDAIQMINRKLLTGVGFENIVHVHHGPVAYEDFSGSFDTGRELDDLKSRLCFTKPNSFSYQSEYRFALWTIGEPTINTIHIPVSDALRKWTSIRGTAP